MPMRKLLKTLFKVKLPLVLLCALALPAMGQGRIATVDMEKVFDHYWKRERANSSLKESQAALEKELQSYLDDYDKSEAACRKCLAVAADQSKSQAERDKARADAEVKQLEIQEAQKNIRLFRANGEAKVESQYKRARQGLLEEIEATVKVKAKDAGYSMVVNSSLVGLDGAPSVLYNTGENDLTEVVLAQLNA